jgi:predicted kinase
MSIFDHKQTLLLIGGMFGSGKSTLAQGIQDEYKGTCFNIDFANLYGKLGGVVMSSTKQADSVRDAIWKDVLLDEIDLRLREGNELVLANSSFLIGERRSVVMDAFSTRVASLGLIMMPPLLTSFHRVRSSRPEGSHPVNVSNARQSLMRISESVISSDNSDLLLPTDKSHMPGEYRAMIARSTQSKFLLQETHDEELKRQPKWVVYPDTLTPKMCIELVNQSVVDPFEIRMLLESHLGPSQERETHAAVESMSRHYRV